MLPLQALCHRWDTALRAPREISRDFRTAAFALALHHENSRRMGAARFGHRTPGTVPGLPHPNPHGRHTEAQMTKRKSRERDGKNSHQPFVLADTDLRPIAWPKSAPPPIALNDEGTQRILDKVGGRFVPRRLKPGALRDDLFGCYMGWCSLSQLTSNKIARQRVQRLETIAKRADAVLALLDEGGSIGGWARQEIAMTFPRNEGAPVRKTAVFRTDHGQPDAAPSFNGFLAGLERLAAAAKYKAKYFFPHALYRLPRSPLEFFVANVLPSVFERHFKRAARFSRAPDSKEIGGPYIRFAVATLKELGITKNDKPYSPETIARALSGVRAGRVRRRKKD